ncbi:MAG: 3-hydroxyacyl-CoA dehydrogenase family protein [Eubacteriales bacterium]
MKKDTILVYGAGMMGKGIAMVMSALSDYEIVLFDVVDSDVLSPIRDNFMQLAKKGVLSEKEIDDRMSRIHFTTDKSEKGISEAVLVIECVFEDMKLKQDTFKELEDMCSEDCIFCTNTSVMSPTEISKDLKHKQRFMGTHFWNPAFLIPLVEVIKTEETKDDAVDYVMDILKKAGKKAVLCKKDVPGFIANRMQHALWREAISIVENGIADAETVDIAVKNSFGLRLPQLPPLENADMVSLELTYNIHNYILPYLEDSHKPSPLLKEMMAKGDNGYKTGKGFFERSEEEIKKQKEDLVDYLIEMTNRKLEEANNG